MKRRGFREQIEEALETRKMQLNEVAARMGTTLGYASRVWNDPEDKISLAVIEKFADAIGIDPIEIDLYVEKKLPELAREAPSLTSLGRDLLMAERRTRRGKTLKRKSA